MRERDELDVFHMLAINDEVRKSPKRHASRDTGNFRSMYDAANRWMLRN